MNPEEFVVSRITSLELRISLTSLSESSESESEPEPESYITIDGQSASVSWNKASIWGLRTDLYYCQTIAGLLM
jgi:hypothetical protein